MPSLSISYCMISLRRVILKPNSYFLKILEKVHYCDNVNSIYLSNLNVIRVYHAHWPRLPPYSICTLSPRASEVVPRPRVYLLSTV